MTVKKWEVPKYNRLLVTAEQRDLIRRRTIPFLVYGLHLSLERLMEEAYIQGMRDTQQVYEANNVK
jgi:hypothetical protein